MNYKDLDVRRSKAVKLNHSLTHSGAYLQKCLESPVSSFDYQSTRADVRLVEYKCMGQCLLWSNKSKFRTLQ